MIIIIHPNGGGFYNIRDAFIDNARRAVEMDTCSIRSSIPDYWLDDFSRELVDLPDLIRMAFRSFIRACGIAPAANVRARSPLRSRPRWEVLRARFARLG